MRITNGRQVLARWILAFVCIAIGNILSAAPARADAIAHLTLQSQPGDFIGQGGSFEITYLSVPPQTFVLHIFTLSNGSPAYLQFVLNQNGPTNTFALVQFATRGLGIPIQPGVYNFARRAAFAGGFPGLDISFQNRGCNTVTGNFTITDATFGANNTLQSFAASFEQHCEGFAPALFGTFTYNANADPVPEPGTLGMLALGIGAAIRTLQRNGPRDKPLN